MACSICLSSCVSNANKLSVFIIDEKIFNPRYDTSLQDIVNDASNHPTYITPETYWCTQCASCYRNCVETQQYISKVGAQINARNDEDTEYVGQEGFIGSPLN